MGLLLKFKAGQRASWDLFFQRGLELFDEGKLIGVPLGACGYGFIGNPFDPSVINAYWKLLGAAMPQSTVFFADSLKGLTHYLQLTTLGKEMGDRFWPGNLALAIRPLFLPNLPPLFREEPYWNTFRQIFQDSLIRVMVPEHPVLQAFFTFLQSHGRPSLLIGNVAEFDPGINVVDPTTLANEFGGENVGAFFDAGKMQRAARPLPHTIVECVSNEMVSILQEGLISADNILDFVEKLPEEGGHAL